MIKEDFGAQLFCPRNRDQLTRGQALLAATEACLKRAAAQLGVGLRNFCVGALLEPFDIIPVKSKRK